jgi:hypothetical protein
MQACHADEHKRRGRVDATADPRVGYGTGAPR